MISRGSRRFDSETKKADDERFGVREYWLIDPEEETMSFFRLKEDRYVDVAASGDAFVSEAVPGFTLDVDRIRRAFHPW